LGYENGAFFSSDVEVIPYDLLDRLDSSDESDQHEYRRISEYDDQTVYDCPSDLAYITLHCKPSHSTSFVLDAVRPPTGPDDCDREGLELASGLAASRPPSRPPSW
jgi:hypothetical protein